VLGVDVSAPMLARAVERLPPGAPVRFVCADATIYRFESAAFDLLFSRFGVMFFAEPARSFCQPAHGAEAKRTPRIRLLAQVR
jgi:ubiquinone/menaquinone biosynthesis C-methylase UbiE